MGFDAVEEEPEQPGQPVQVSGLNASVMKPKD